MKGSHEGRRDEMRAAWIYRVMAEHERGTTREALFNELAGEAEEQAARKQSFNFTCHNAIRHQKSYSPRDPFGQLY
jgi:hypothetical protein